MPDANRQLCRSNKHLRGHDGCCRHAPKSFIDVEDQKILTTLSRVLYTPQASGMPTKAQNSAALASSPPLPMPNEPCWIAASLFALADCSLETSSVLMCHLWSTGLIR